MVTTSNVDGRYVRGRKGTPGGFGISNSGLRYCSDILLPLRTHWSKLDLWATWASLVAQLVKNLPAVQETWVQFLGQEDPLEKWTTESQKTRKFFFSEEL